MTAIMGSLDPGRDPTEADEAYMNSLQRELEAFRKDVMAGRL